MAWRRPPWTSSHRRATPPCRSHIRSTARPGVPTVSTTTSTRPYTALHRSPPAIVALYDEGCEVIHAQVRAAFWDKAPDRVGADPADLERPHVEVGFPDSGDVQLYLNPGQARSFAAALIRSADAADTEAFYRPPFPPGMTSTAVPASAPSRQA